MRNDAWFRSRICGRANGSIELTDGVHAWPEGLAHYLRDHHVVLPRTVSNAVVERYEQLELEDRENDWWIATTRDAHSR